MKEHFCPAEQSMITYQGKCNWCGESEGSMNEIIDMARQAGIIHPEMVVKHLEAFAKLVAAKEREACAKVCEEVGEHPSLTPLHCAESIRERGEA
jgi:hypothetical protein